MWRSLNTAIAGSIFAFVIVLSACSLFTRHDESPSNTTEEPKKDTGQAEAETPVANEAISLSGIKAEAPSAPAPTEATGAAPPAPETQRKSHWDYAGETGPEHWQELDPGNVLCGSGKAQSPVNLKWSAPLKGGGELRLNYKTSPLKLMDNGHSLQIGFDPGSSIQIRGHEYELIQAHFHTPAEHQLSGKTLPMELHLVHKDENGKLAVLGVFMNVGPVAHASIDKIWRNWPLVKDKGVQIEDESLNPISLLPKRFTYYQYTGSLTTPPCAEGVDWNVFNTPIEISREQLEAFRTKYTNNARPIQALNKRKVVNY